MTIVAEALLLRTGAVLLALAAFTGFAQATARGSSLEAQWRVVHNGGTAGGVQLLVLAVAWPALAGQSLIAPWVALAIIVATWCFFIGPLLKVRSQARAAQLVLLAGAVVSVPGYVGLLALGLL
jgi:hypothetical protein